jgi:hypothetical protein
MTTEKTIYDAEVNHTKANAHQHRAVGSAEMSRTTLRAAAVNTPSNHSRVSASIRPNLRGSSRTFEGRAYVINRVHGTRGCQHGHDEDDLKNQRSLVVIGIRHRYHKIQEFKK